MAFSPRSWLASWLILWGATCFPPPLGAHDDPARVLSRLDAQAAVTPADPGLELARGEYLRLAGRLVEADLAADAALRRGADSSEVLLLRAAIALDAGHAAEACPLLSHILESTPRHAPALLLRSRAWRAAGRLPESFADLRSYLDGVPAPGVERWIECAELGREISPDDADVPLAILDESMLRLGPSPVLLLHAARLETAAGRYEAALARLDRLPASLRATGRVHLERARVLESAGRPWEARAALTDGLDAIAALPPERRATRAAIELESELRRLLARRPFSSASAEE